MFKGDVFPLLLLFLITLAIYSHSYTHDFLVNWDDQIYVTHNSDITAITLENLKRAFTQEYAAIYVPLSIVSYMIDYKIWGLNAAGFILTNILLHAANGALFYLILVRITGLRLLAFLAAALFVAHPVQVESVAWISQRKNVLAMLFFLLSFLSYLIWVEKGRTKNKQYFLSLVFFGMSLLAKPAGVVLPVVLLLYDFCLRRDRSFWKSLTDKAPYLVMSALFSVAALVAQGQAGAKITSIGGTSFSTLLNVLPAFGKYLILLLCPLNLSVNYNPPIKTSLDAEVVLSALLILLFLAGWGFLYSRRKDLFFWIGLFIIPLVPVSGIIPQGTIMNDRYLYFPMLGFAAFIAFGPVLFFDRALDKSKHILRISLVGMLITLGIMSWQRSTVWQNSITLWSDALIKQPEGSWYNFDTHFAEKCLAEGYAEQGLAYHFRGREIAARDSYLKALAYDPLSPKALYNIAALYSTKGLVEPALKYALRFNENHPHDHTGFVLVGTIYTMTGELDKAERYLSRAVQMNPYDETARMKLRIVESQITLRIGDK